jgi:ABC-type multidrug transport system permease subunit
VGQYENNQFKRALKTFRQVNELNPDYPYVQDYLSKIQEALNQRGDRPLLWVVGAGSVVVLLLGAGGVYILRRRGQTKVPKASAN